MTPRSIKTRTTNSEIKVRIPQMSVTLLLRTAVSSFLERLVTRLAALILPNLSKDLIGDRPGGPILGTGSGQASMLLEESTIPKIGILRSYSYLLDTLEASLLNATNHRRKEGQPTAVYTAAIASCSGWRPVGPSRSGDLGLRP